MNGFRSLVGFRWPLGLTMAVGAMVLAVPGPIEAAGSTPAQSGVAGVPSGQHAPAEAGGEAVPIGRWQLSTGSRLAYVHVAASGAAKRSPVVFLHGGPGACEVFAYPMGRVWYERLAAQGYDVYLYDQIGSGYSERLSDPRAYTLSRHVADLEAIRQKIGCEQFILIGESHGATLAASYLATHPERVARVAFVSPGLIEHEAGHRSSMRRTPTVPEEFLEWVVASRDGATAARCRKLDELLRRDVRAAYVFAGDAEMDALMSAWISERILPTCVHDLGRLHQRRFEIPQMGWWSFVMTNWDETSHARPVRKRLESCRVPVLVLRGDSDYLPSPIANAYLRTFPGATFVGVADAGHFIWLDQPERYRTELESFLRSDASGATAGRILPGAPVVLAREPGATP